MKKLALLISMLLILAMGALLPTVGYAAQQGDYIYTIDSGKATINR